MQELPWSPLSHLGPRFFFIRAERASLALLSQLQIRAGMFAVFNVNFYKHFPLISRYDNNHNRDRNV